MLKFSLLLVGLASATVHYVEAETSILDFDNINQLDSLAQRELQRQLHEHYGSVEVAEGAAWTVYGGGATNFRRAHAQLRSAHSHNDYHFKHEAAFATKFVCSIFRYTGETVKTMYPYRFVGRATKAVQMTAKAFAETILINMPAPHRIQNVNNKGGARFSVSTISLFIFPTHFGICFTFQGPMVGATTCLYMILGLGTRKRRRKIENPLKRKKQDPLKRKKQDKSKRKKQDKSKRKKHKPPSGSKRKKHRPLTYKACPVCKPSIHGLRKHLPEYCSFAGRCAFRRVSPVYLI